MILFDHRTALPYSRQLPLELLREGASVVGPLQIDRPPSETATKGCQDKDDVTDQVQAQPHGGVIVVKDIVIEAYQGMQSSGGFDVNVSDWGEYEDISLPL